MLVEEAIVRPKFVASNWKMFTHAASAERLATGIVQGLGGQTSVRVAVCPPFPYLMLVRQVLSGSPIALGAQNCYCEPEGAFTGEVSPTMLMDVGCRYVILGHSERRHKLGESDALINRKVHAALAAGLQVILCVGETLGQRQAQETETLLDMQLDSGLAGLNNGALDNVVLAYEPVWAIGTGQNATPEQAQQAHAFLRQRVGEKFGSAAAANLLILYGGSAKPENAASLLTQPDVDGGLIGGASLQAELFLAIIRICQSGR
jgi:triosephosphate isomerase